MTQVSVCAAAGVSLATVQNIEAGTANPSLGTLRKLCDVLGLRLAVLPRAADWNLLARLALPLSTTGSRARGAEIGDLPEQVTRAALELAEEGSGEAHQRKLESLQALLLALRQHFPSTYRQWFGRVPIVRRMVPRAPSGRVIKLARVARARLVEIL